MAKAVTLIIDPELYEKARKLAKLERRSTSAQISVWIEQKVKDSSDVVVIPQPREAAQ